MRAGPATGNSSSNAPQVVGPRLALALRPVLMPALGVACGFALAALLLSGAGGGDAPRGALAAAPPPEALVERVARLEARLARPDAAPRDERFIAAALLLQSAIATPRPWLREYQAMARLAPPGALPAPLAEVLLSHAARGVPSEAELRERYVALQPRLLARAPRPDGLVQQAALTVRAAASGIGLMAAPAPTDHEQAIAGVAQQLRRGNLAAAVADAAALDPALQPLLAGWLAQAGARLAVEQALQETLLRMLAPSAPPG